MDLIRRRNKQNGSDLSFPWHNSLWEADKFFDSFFGRPWSYGADDATSWVPPVDVTETDKSILVRSEVPGVDPKEISITVDNGILTLTGEKKETTEHKDEETNTHRVERRFGSFQRSFKLPTSVDPEKVTADYGNGVLTVTILKKEQAVAKQIPVSVK